MKRFYIYFDGLIDHPARENLTIEEVMEYVGAVELTDSDKKLKEFRPDVFDLELLKRQLLTFGVRTFHSGWGRPAFGIARDIKNESAPTTGDVEASNE